MNAFFKFILINVGGTDNIRRKHFKLWRKCSTLLIPKKVFHHTLLYIKLLIKIKKKKIWDLIQFQI